MMDNLQAIRRAQVYSFLAGALLYPRANWTEETESVAQIVRAMGWLQVPPDTPTVSLSDLQKAYRYTFGAAGSLGYETEYGLPHEYRQSHEMADIAGFYRAFGFKLGGAVRERPDHVAVELEFMHVLALMEAHAQANENSENAEVCRHAQVMFLGDHLGRWIDLFAQGVALNAPESLYAALTRFAADFVCADADRLGVDTVKQELTSVQHTPFDPDFSCAGCDFAGPLEHGLIRASTIR